MRSGSGGGSPRQGSIGQVAQGQGQGVGPVRWGGLFRQVEQDLHHALDLFFTGIPPSGDGLLHLVRAVLGHGDAGLRGRRQG